MHRHARRCAAPGCRSGVFLDVHHVRPRAEGLDHDPDNLVVLCGAHHRALHRGTLVIEGRFCTGLTFRHADGTSYGGDVSPHQAEVSAQAFGALKWMGFGERAARAAVQSALAHVGTRATTEEVLRRALEAGVAAPKIR